LVEEILTSETTGNFEWVTDNGDGYEEDEVVTWQGNWYQSLEDDNLNNIPGIDPTKWLLVTKSASGFVFWQAGIFPQDEVFVLRSIGGMIHLVHLVNATRPFISTDFDAEYAAGDWEIMSSDASPNTEVDTTIDIVLDFKNKNYGKFFGSNIISTAKNLSLLYDANGDEFKFIFIVDNVAAVLELPANFQLDNALWDSVAKTWSPVDLGKYKMRGDRDGTNWTVEIFGPYN
jgi:hypothetical protein